MIERRTFVKALGAAGVGLLGHVRAGFAAEPPPETTRIRVASVPSVCLSPQYVAEELLRLEGFTDIRFGARCRQSFDEGASLDDWRFLNELKKELKG